MSTSARLKRELAVYGTLLGVTFVVLGVLSMAGAGYVYLNPPTEEIPPEEFDVQEFETTVDETAVVTGESPLYDQGEELRNMPVYFTNATPELTFSITSELPDDREVEVTHRLIVTHEATFDDEPFWEQRELLLAEETTTTEGRYRTNVTVSIADLDAEIGRVEGTIAEVGDLSTQLHVETAYATDAEGGETYEGELVDSTPVEIATNAYWFPETMSASETHRQLGEGETRQLPPNTTAAGGLGTGGVVGIVAGIGLILWKSRQADVYELEMEIVRSRYDEWISEGEFPAGSEKQYIYINSLEDLVDVAIDTNKRVIYDPDLETYSVVDGDLIYYHAVDPTRIDSWLGLSSESS